jgi:SAM-dependent methyltransferase
MASQTQRDGVASVADHYDRLLAEHYTWMSGDFAEKVSEQRALLSSLGLPRSGSRRALDLGSGPGFQSIALAEIGYEVTALDTSRKLLAELTDRKGSLPIAAVEADIAAGLPMIEPGVEVALCMGDTLTHLSSKDDVLRLFTEVHRLLAPGGRFVLGFRDLTAELRGTDRFIPVRSDSHRIMTCFLEYEPETVIVHDLIHVRDGEDWVLRKSSYRKLRLAPDWVAARLTACGFAVQRAEPIGRMSVIVADRP